MKIHQSYITLFFLLFMHAYSYTQILEKKDALKIARQLYEIEILSKKGEALLIQKIEKNDLLYLKSFPLKKELFFYSDTLTVSGILYFCSQAFGSEYLYRSGYFERKKIADDWQKKNKGKTITPKVREILRTKENELLKNFPGSAIEQKIKHQKGASSKNYTIYLNFLPQAETHGLIHHNRSALGKTQTLTLNDLKNIALINDHIYSDLLDILKISETPIESYALYYAAERVAFYEGLKANKEPVCSFLDSLQKKEIISKENLKNIINAYEKHELKNGYDILPYCNKVIIINLNEYPDDPEQAYPLIFSKIKDLIPSFNYSNFNFEIKPIKNTQGSFSYERILHLSLIADGKEYKHSYYYDFLYKEKSVKNKSEKLASYFKDFFKIVNKYLIDQNSKFRLHSAFNNLDNKSSEIGLILLTEKQFIAWKNNDIFNQFLSKEDYSSRFTSIEINRYITRYEKIGLFHHLGKTEISQGIARAHESEIKTYQDILRCFSKIVVSFDWESGNLENPYEELTLEFAAASGGIFQPTNIVDHFKDDLNNSDITPYGFHLNNKKYTNILRIDGDWLDPAFLHLINRAIIENTDDSKFYQCLDNGQVAGYIFLTPKQFQYLKDNQPTLFSNY